MRIFTVAYFNRKDIRFKDNKDIIDSCLKEVGVSYNGIAFCSGYHGENDGKKIFATFPQLKKYDQFGRRFRVGKLTGSPHHYLASYSHEDNIDNPVYINQEDEEVFSAFLKKVPRPFGFGDITVTLDNIDWYGDGIINPPFYRNYRFEVDVYGSYIHNCISFWKVVGYGNKYNPITVMVERRFDDKEMLPLPPKFLQFCDLLGKHYLGAEFCYDKEEVKIKQTKEAEIKAIVNADKGKYDYLFNNLMLYKNLSFEESRSLIIYRIQPVKGIPFKKIFIEKAKRTGYTYHRCVEGNYIFTKVGKYGHCFEASLTIPPFTNEFFGNLTARSYNFGVFIADTPGIYIRSQEDVEEYAELFFEVVEKAEKEYEDILFEKFGRPPEWYLKNKR